MVNTNYWYKVKPILLTVITFLLLNGYLIYIVSRYIMDVTTRSVIVLITNEILIMLGIVTYLVIETRIYVNSQIEHIRNSVNRTGEIAIQNKKEILDIKKFKDNSIKNEKSENQR